jgi:LuxR family maltose regulon positive regulatory protein
LLDQLDRGDQVRLALVVGPAGAGKTMLLADWLAVSPKRSSAWLSCDAADADPARFAAAIIEAARYGFGEPSIGADARQLIDLDGGRGYWSLMTFSWPGRPAPILFAG